MHTDYSLLLIVSMIARLFQVLSISMHWDHDSLSSFAIATGLSY
jgi:hypothetical protein